MSQDTRQQDISKKRVVYTIPGVDAVKVRRDEAYRATGAGSHTIDLYYPPDSTSLARTPAVIFVTGFSDLGAQKMIGCKQKEMGSYISWGQLAAASGLVGITYEHRTGNRCSGTHPIRSATRRIVRSRREPDRRVGVFRQCSDGVVSADAGSA